MGSRQEPTAGSTGLGSTAVDAGYDRPPHASSRESLRPSPGTAVIAFLVILACASPSKAQEPDQASDTPPLSARYRLSERYSAEPDPKKPDALTQYRVGSRETVKIVRDRPQGTPDRVESTLQMIYTERVAKVVKEAVTDMVRRYDNVNFKTTLPIQPFKTKWLEGMMIHYHVSNLLIPSIISLTDRTIRQQEFDRISQQAYLPALATVIPRKPIRVGDTWSVVKAAAWAMIGDLPIGEDYDVTAELIEVHRNKTGNSMTAVIAVKGQFSVAEGPTAINAQIDFTFEPMPVQQPPTRNASPELPRDRPAATDPADRAVTGLFDAKGFISKLRLGQGMTLPLPEGDGRLKQSISRELFVERRVPGPSNGGSDLALLPLPPASSSPSQANSWLVYDDPKGRFHFQYPQDLKVAPQAADGSVLLADRRLDGSDLLHLAFLPRIQNTEQDRLATDPIQQKKKMEDKWKRERQQFRPGPAGWLADPEFTRLNRKVYRHEAALLEAEDAPGPIQGNRVYYDHYTVLFGQNAALDVTAMTKQDPHLNFIKTTESVIKSFRLGSSDAVAPSDAPTEPGPTGATPAPPARPGPG